MIRKANIDDMPEILRIYSAARQFMMENGNPTQWGESYPQKSILLEDIICGQLFIEEIEGKAHGVFAFILGEDPSYHAIVDGEWLSDSPYGTIHRVASDGRAKGKIQAISYRYRLSGQTGAGRTDLRYDSDRLG